MSRQATLDDALALLRRYGTNSFSGFLLYDSMRRYVLSAGDGFVGYLESGRILVAFGEPVCAPGRYLDAAREFIAFAAARRKHVAFFAVSQAFLEAARVLDPTWMFLGEDFIFDVATYEPRGVHAKKVRSARNQFVRHGGRVVEFTLADLARPALADGLRDMAQRWLRSKSRFQVHMLDLELAHLAEHKRYFYAEHHGQPVALLACLPIFGRQGYLYEDLVRHPEAPLGATELLVLETLRVFREEGVPMATFGLSPLLDPSRSNLSGPSTLIARLAIAFARQFSNLDGLHHYRKKYHTPIAEPSYLVKYPAGVGLRDVWGLMEALHVTPTRSATSSGVLVPGG